MVTTNLNSKADLLEKLRAIDSAMADESMRKVMKMQLIQLYNKSHPHNKYLDWNEYYPQTAEARARWNRFATKTLDLDPLKKITNFGESVLLTGATGTGKELLANALHGDRKGKFVTINCAAMTESLLNSELFGHEKGSFTGADKSTPGLFSAARDGTIFIDELCAATRNLQVKFLRVLEYGTYRPVGAVAESSTNARVVFATSGDVSTLLPDLLGRIPFDYHIPPLAERLEDIPEILDIVDADGQFPRDFEWKAHMLPYNVRSLKKAVLQYVFYKKLPV